MFESRSQFIWLLNIHYCNHLLQILIDKQTQFWQATRNHHRSCMMGSLDEMQLLQNLARAIGAKKTLDIGLKFSDKPKTLLFK